MVHVRSPPPAEHCSPNRGELRRLRHAPRRLRSRPRRTFGATRHHSIARSSVMSQQLVDRTTRPAAHLDRRRQSRSKVELTERSLGGGYDYEHFLDGSIVVERLAAGGRQPDVLLLDWVMPTMTGDEVCRFLRSHPATAELPIILVTASRIETARCRRGPGDRRQRLRRAPVRRRGAARSRRHADPREAPARARDARTRRGSPRSASSVARCSTPDRSVERVIAALARLARRRPVRRLRDHGATGRDQRHLDRAPPLAQRDELLLRRARRDHRSGRPHVRVGERGPREASGRLSPGRSIGSA